MSRIAQPISLNIADINVLTGITNGSVPAGDDVKTRAEVLLSLNQGMSGKDVAKALSIRENTVSDIRRRFLDKGIGCLSTAKKSGRPLSADPGQIELKINEIIADAYREKKPVPSVEDISRQLNAPVLMIRHILKEKKIIKERARKWDFQSSDGLDVKSVALAALYLSYNQQVLVIKTSTDDSSICLSENGLLETRSSGIANRLQSDSTDDNCIMLADALDAFSQSAAVCRTGKNVNAFSYLKSVLPGLPNHPHCEYHLFACGDPVVNSEGAVIRGAVLHASETQEVWLRQVESVLSLLAPCENGYTAAVRITTGIYQYLKMVSAESDAFTWSKVSVQEQPAEQFDKMSESENAAPGTIEFTGRIMGTDGKWITATTFSSMPISEEEFDSSSRRGYLKSFDQIEQAIGNAVRESARRMNEKYMLEMVKKKRNK